MTDKVGLYAAVNETIYHYEVNISEFVLEKRGLAKAPARVQYAWPNQAGTVLYIASSDGGPGRSGSNHKLGAFAIDPSTGGLTEYGAPVEIPERPIHISLTIDGRYALVTFNRSAMIEVYRVNQDGTIGEKVDQPVIDAGVYAHQARQADDGTVIAVGLGNPAMTDVAGDPGTLSVFAYDDGKFEPTQRLVMPDNLGLRHLAFSADQSFIYVVVERGNKLLTYGLSSGQLSSEPIYRTEILADPDDVRAGQHAGTVHLHPNGEILYVANRASALTQANGVPVFAGGENNIAVFALDSNGEPDLIQTIDTAGFEARTFSIDPSGRMMVVGNQIPVNVKVDGAVTLVPAGLVVFRIKDDGTLALGPAYHTGATAERPMFWTGMVARTS